MDFLSCVYERNQCKRRMWPIFDTFIGTVKQCLRAYFVFYAIALTGAVYLPFFASLVIYFVYDKRMLAYPLIIPYTSLESDTHYEINLMCHLFMGWFDGAVHIYFDAIFVVQLMHTILMANVVCDRIRETEEILVAQRMAPADISEGFRGVIQLQNELKE